MGYIYDATGRKISQEVYDEQGLIVKKSDYEGEFFYENDTLRFINHEEGRAIISDAAPEYQYHLKDHLGNVRLTFTTKEEIEAAKATLEPEDFGNDYSNFVRYKTARKVQSYFFDRTKGVSPSTATGYAQRLNGGTNGKFGLGRSLSVMPGDKITAEVYAKYVDPDAGSRTDGLNSLLSQIAQQIASGATTSGLVIDGSSFTTSTTSFPFPTEAGLNTSGSSGLGPKAYLNWLVFDRDYNFLLSESGYMRLSDAPKESGQDVAHERLYSPEIVIKQPGYVYIYLSNENETPVEVYFDDFNVGHQKSPVVQMDDYYPFGLTFNSYKRENSFDQKFLYNGKEFQDELQLDWLDYGARMYDTQLGRFHIQDAFAEKYYSMSPYQYGANDPINVIDVNGDSIWYTRDNNVITMHITGKVMNRSNDDIDMDETISDITSSLARAFSGEVEIDGKTYKLETDVQLSEATSMEDVAKSDHLVVLANGKEEKGNARGTTSMPGGKVIHLYSGDYPTDSWYSPGWSNTRSAVHEFGHAAGLGHTNQRRNAMVQGGSGANITSRQREAMIRTRRNINNGPNSYSNPFTGNEEPYPYLHYYNPNTRRYERAHINNAGLYTK